MLPGVFPAVDLLLDRVWQTKNGNQQKVATTRQKNDSLEVKYQFIQSLDVTCVQSTKEYVSTN